MTHIDVNGQQLWIEDHGGDGPALLFSHGFMMDGRMFEPVIQQLQDRYRCITWDQRGHGRTVDDGQPFTYWDSAADAIGVLDALGIDRAVLAGMSQGGFVSLRATLDNPDRVNALVFFSSHPVALDAETIEAFRQLQQGWPELGPDGLGDMLAGMLIGDPEHSKTWIERWRSQPDQRIVNPLETLIGVDDVTARLAEVAVPSLHFHGADDAAMPIELGQMLADGLPDSRGFHLVVGGGHAAVMTHPDQVLPELSVFLDHVVGSTR